MKTYLFMLAGLIAIGIVPNCCLAQVILYGCTASLTGQPQTTNKIVDIDIVTGLATNPRDTGLFAVGGIAIQPSTGLLFGLTTFVSNQPNSLVQIDPSTGGVTLIGSTGLSQIVEGDLAFNPVDGLLYGVQQPGGAGIQRNLFRIDPVTGAATVVGSTGSTGDLSALAFNSSGVLFALDTSGITNSLLHTINPNTGFINSTMQMNFDLGGSAGMAFDPNTGLGYVADGGSSGTNVLYTIETNLGQLTPIGSLGIGEGLSGLTFTSVPEPSSFMLVGSAMFVFAKLVRGNNS